MLQLDSLGYTELRPLLERECQRRKIPFEVAPLNTAGFGDVFFVGSDGTYSAEIKGAGELLGGIDHMVRQLKAQRENCTHCFLFVYGAAEPTDDGMTRTLKQEGGDQLVNGRAEAHLARRYLKKREFRIPWVAFRKILWRVRQEGIHVIEVADLGTLASELASWYETGTTEGTTFSKVSVEKSVVSERDPAKRRFMLQLMGLQAGIGEEIAEAIAEFMKKGYAHHLGLANLVDGFDKHEGFAATLASLPLRSGKRTIGPAAVARLRDALGC